MCASVAAVAVARKFFRLVVDTTLDGNTRNAWYLY